MPRYSLPRRTLDGLQARLLMLLVGPSWFRDSFALFSSQSLCHCRLRYREG